MAEKLGIAVTTQGIMKHVLGLARAASDIGKETEVFFTGEGVHLTQDTDFPELVNITRVTVCESSYFARGYKGLEIPGMIDKDFTTQAHHAELVETSDRYVIL
ncbi:DsrE family protein [Chloroflexota bacterium]